MNKNYYVVLTGAKNNVGDFLIKERTNELLLRLRSDREIINLNAWEHLDKEKLEIVNKSKALILAGGPSIVNGMYPRIYKLTKNLNDIKVPIIMMGVGWKHVRGFWKDIYNYSFDEMSLKLLNRVNESGFLSSVRDYHTLHLLNRYGLRNFLMTGCPVYYDLNHIGKKVDVKNKLENVIFSMGVTFVRSRSMEKLSKDVILFLKENFKSVKVAFHHSINIENLNKSYGESKDLVNFYKKHKEFVKWLESLNITYIDVSKNLRKFIDVYSRADIHIGFRVHAHIYMSSISKPTILISEDSRGIAVEKVIGGINILGYLDFKLSKFYSLLKKIFSHIDLYRINKQAVNELQQHLYYEYMTNFHRTKVIRKVIDSNYRIMKKFLNQLP